MKKIISFYLLVCVQYSKKISALPAASSPIPYALSPVYLEFLENTESNLYYLLKGKLVPNEDSILKKYVLDYEETLENHKNTTRNGRSHHGKNAISSNPILSLQMINRYVKYFKNKEFSSTAINVLHLDKDLLPSSTEIEDAMEALLRLQHIYDLDAAQLADGILNGVQTTARLTSRECYELGKFAQESTYFTLALQWYDAALQKLKSGDAQVGLNPNLILKAIQETIKEHNHDYEENMENGDMYSFSSPIDDGIQNYSSIAHLSLRKRIPEELVGKFLPDSDPKFQEAIDANMIALCSGRSLKSEKEKAKLKCWLDTKRHPYWSINPLKIEALHEEPLIVQFYDIFSERWVAYLKSLSYSELERAPQPEDATPRTAAYAWFDDGEIPKAPVSRRVEFITGLNVRGSLAAEALQVAAYAFGGHVEPHFDSRGPDDLEFHPKGDRVTTFLVYLNEVEQGGLTAFPLLGFYVKPVRNSAVLWYTNLKNGAIDERTLHAACPVITGQKWIATKWTHINENILKRPCGLKDYE